MRTRLTGSGPTVPVRLRNLLLTALAAISALACASTGATFRSGVGDSFPEHPPFYAGAPASAVTAGGARLGHLPIAYQRGASQTPIFDPSLSPAMLALLADMNAYLDSLGVSVRLVEGGRVSAVSHADTRQPPDVIFDCPTGTGVQDGDCADEGDGALGRGRMTMRLAVGRPSPEWTSWMRQVMMDVGVDRTLVITLEVGRYRIRQRGLRGTKEVELGTSYATHFPWLTALETPVPVLQLTGAVVGADGRAIRIGAEGLTARRTSMWISAIGGQTLITDAEVEELRGARREDLPGSPLVWREGMRTLVAQLTGRPTPSR